MRDLRVVPNTDVSFKEWLSPQTDAILLLVHGLGAHVDRWAFLAEFFKQKNVSSYAIALRGFNGLGKVPGHVDSFNVYYEDIFQLYNYIRAEHSNKKIFVLGESLGGLIAFVLTARNPRIFSGMILLSPGFLNNMHLTIKHYSQVLYGVVFNKTLQIKMPFNSEMCTQDSGYQKVMNECPDEVRVATAWLLFETLLAQVHSLNLAKSIDIPVQFLISGDDQLVNSKASKQVFKLIKSKDKKLIEYPGMRHALSIELEREKVFAHINSWLVSHK